MANLWLSQYKLVVGKNLKLKKTSKCGTCVECFFPIIVIIILIGFMQALLPSSPSRFERTLPPAALWLQEKNVLLYTPNDAGTNETMNIFSLMQLQVPLNETTFIKGFSTPAEMQQYYLDNEENTWAGVEFSNTLDTVAYAIRIDFYEIPDTEKRTDNDAGLSGNKDYMSTGFTSLQCGLDSALLTIAGINTTTLISPNVSEFDFHEPDLWERYLTNLSGVYVILGPIFIVIALFVSNFRYLASIVAEKEAKIREEMRMMGLLPGVDNWAWFTTVMLVAIIPTFIISLVLKAQFYHNSSAATILFVIFSELFSLYSLAILVSLFVSKAKFAGVIGFVIAIAMAIIGVVVQQIGTGEGVKLFLALLSPAALVFANRSIIASEKAMVGTDSGNLGEKWRDDTPSVGAMIAFMYLDTLLYAFLAWYIDNVFPGEFGIARPPWFFVTKRYWSDLLGLRDTPHEGLLTHQETSEDVEAVGDDMKDRAAVVIKKLKKTFTKGFRKFHAVDGLDMIMYDGQITAFLGHNGAGKTTTISMLTGLIPLSGGDAYVRGYSIRNQMRQVRKTLGICPQHDVIWPELSVYDHLFLYAGLKGVPYREIKKAVNELIQEIGLEEKRNFPSGALSGGQKRKLCLAMAFIGGSDVIFLDEPTSGMDPVTRRGVWDFLNANKKGKTIVLTTHFMDEADFLGDRVAIISHGSLRCAGSSLFLKSRMGVGYLLTMTKNKSCDSTKVDQLVLNSIQGSNILAAFGGELSYRLPKEAAANFPEFFAHLDESKEALGIDSYGVSLTTLEEVFLRIGMEEKVDKDDDEEGEGGANNNKELTSLGKDQEKINVALAHETKGHRFSQQLRALLVKRAIIYRRDVRGMLFTFFLPFLFLILSSAVIRSTDTLNIETEPPAPLNISTALYERPYFVTGDPAWISTNPLYNATEFIARDLDGFDKFIKDDWEGRASGAYHLENLGTDFTRLQPVTSYGIEFNKTFLHIIPAELTFVSNALLRRFSTTIQNIQVINKPFPHVLTALEEAASSINPDLMYWSLIMLATFCLIPAGFVASIVQERVLNVKRLLSVSGASKSSYWASNFIFDWLMFLVLVLVAIIVVAAAGGKNFESDTIGAVFLLMFLFSLFITAQSYFLSLAFNSYSVVTGALFAFHFIMALAFNIGYNIVTFRAIEGKISSGSLDTIFYVFNVVSPQFGFVSTLQLLGGFISMYRKEDTWYTINLVGFPMLMCTLHFFFWTGLLLLIEYRDQIAGRFKGEPQQNGIKVVTPANEDSDVSAERQRLINDPNAQNDLVRVIGLRKEYPAPKGGIKVAVKNLSLGIPRSECFGLLGMNGAGKSTTLGALSGDIKPTHGDIWLNNYNLATHPNDALKYFGWCPQFDALIGNLTGREQLTMYARIKGLDEKVIPETVSAFIQMLDLKQYASRPVRGYSGGNKRKLSLAVAMIGNPPIVFLDEPSTGMDPLARRYMWNVITALGANKSVIVTTHSMEECDALATRIGIMSQGELVCLGTSQHLKSRFASGYSIQLKTKDHSLERVKAHVARAFPLARIADEHGGLLAYELPQTAGYKLSQIFAELQSLGSELEDFSVSQTTLEQVFLKLAKEKAEGSKVEVVVVN